MSSIGIKLNYLLGSGPGSGVEFCLLDIVKIVIRLGLPTKKGKKMRAIKVEGDYRLYKIGNSYELWLGTYTLDKYSDKGSMVGYVSDPENFKYAIDVAKEELAYMMDEVC
jgi:hypothetical protein